MMVSTTSLPMTFFLSLPSTWNLIDSGTLNHRTPLAKAVAASVLPMPVANAPSPP